MDVLKMFSNNPEINSLVDKNLQLQLSTGAVGKVRSRSTFKTAER
jgi:hypothetical protein